MTNYITSSKETQDHISALALPTTEQELTSNSLALKTLLKLLNESPELLNLQLEALRLSLLKDLRSSLDPDYKEDKAEQKKIVKLLLIICTAAGTFEAIAEGVDAGNTIFENMKNPASWPRYALVALMVSFSLLIFYGFDQVEISNNLGADFIKIPDFLDSYLAQLEQIAQIRKQIDKVCRSEHGPLTAEASSDYKLIMAKLETRLEAMNESMVIIKKKRNYLPWEITRRAMALMIGVLYAGTGYFTAQALIIGFIAWAFPALAIPAFGAILIGLSCALISYGIYCAFQRPGVENMFDRIRGLDGDKVNRLEESVSEEFDLIQSTLSHVEKKIENRVLRGILAPPEIPTAQPEDADAAIQPKRPRSHSCSDMGSRYRYFSPDPSALSHDQNASAMTAAFQ